MIEKLVIAEIVHLAGGSVFYDVAPPETPLPYITLQQVGGDSIQFLDMEADKDVSRLQIDVFAGTRPAANELMTQVRQILAAKFMATVVGAPFSDYEDSVKTYRRSCDFRILASI